MKENKKGFLHPFIDYLIESKQLQIIVEEYVEVSSHEENVIKNTK